MKTLQALHGQEKALSAKLLFKGSENTTTALQIRKNGRLEEHITKVEALLVCISGDIVFENERGMRIELQAGSYVEIAPMVKHWLTAAQDSQLLLIK